MMQTDTTMWRSAKVWGSAHSSLPGRKRVAHLQFNPVLLRRLGCALARVALVDIGEVHALAYGGLHARSQGRSTAARPSIVAGIT